MAHLKKQTIGPKGGSPGLVVKGEDSCSEGCGFESQQRMDIFTFICCTNCNVCLKRPKINKKRPRIAILKKEMDRNKYFHLKSPFRKMQRKSNELCQGLVLAKILDQTQCDQIWRNFTTLAKKLKSFGQFLKLYLVLSKMFCLLWAHFLCQCAKLRCYKWPNIEK